MTKAHRRARLQRYRRSLRLFWSTALAAELEYQANALVELVAVLGNLAGSLFVLSLLYGHGRDLGGWSWDAALVVLGLYTLLDGFTSCLLQPNLSKIVGHVQNGTLDFVLLKPIDSQLWLSARQISPWGLPGVLAGLGLIVWGLTQAGPAAAWSDPTVGLRNLGLGLTLLFCAAAILYSLWFLLAGLSIWFVKVWNATEVLRTTLVAGRYPVSAYPPALRLLFTFVLPVAFLTTVPAEALLGRASGLWVAGSLLAAGLSLALSRAFWRRALRHYTSASS
jgi:ABC-2 type transport system permease protein